MASCRGSCAYVRQNTTRLTSPAPFLLHQFNQRRVRTSNASRRQSWQCGFLQNCLFPFSSTFYFPSFFLLNKKLPVVQEDLGLGRSRNWEEQACCSCRGPPALVSQREEQQHFKRGMERRELRKERETPAAAAASSQAGVNWQVTELASEGGLGD